MNLQDQIYDALWAEYGAQGQFLWEEVTRSSAIPYRLGTGTPGRAEKQASLLRAAELAQRDLISHYLAAAYPNFERGHALTMSENAFTTFSGSIDDRLLDLVIVSTLDFRTASLDPMSALPVAAKAFALGFEKADVAALDRSNQQWFWYSVEGDFEGAYRHLRNALDGQQILRSPNLTVTPNHLLTQEMDALLRSIGTNKAIDGSEKIRTKRVIHPSEISTSACDRLIGYGLLGESEQEQESFFLKRLRKIFDLGHLYHNLIQQALGWAFPDFRAEVRAVHPDLRIEGHCDGVFGRRGVEIKSISLAGFQKLSKPKPEHVEQATLYAVLLDLDLVSYIYVCKETAELKIFDVPVDRKLWHRMAGRAAKILRQIEKEELPEPVTGKDSTCKTCKYAWTCRTDLVRPKAERMFNR